MSHLLEVARLLALIPQAQIDAAIARIRQCAEQGGTVYTCGNGGSAAIASHFTCDLMKWSGVKSQCLSDNVALVTAYANDEGYDSVFLRQLHPHNPTTDVVVLLSVSGQSHNLLTAAEQMRGCDNFIVLTGERGAPLVHASRAHNPIIVPSAFHPAVEDVFSAICHAIAVGVKA